MKYVVGAIYLVCLVLVNVCFLSAEDDSTLFSQANEYYREAKYEEARLLYESLIYEKKLESAELFYNVGNCYFKENHLGKAVISYKRAFAISPRDKAIKKNLAFVRRLVKYKVDDARNWYMRKAYELLSYVTLGELQIACLSVLLLLIVYLLCSVWMGSKIFRRLSIWSLVFFLIFIGLVIMKMYPLYIAQEAIILADDVAVRYGPSSGDKVAFRLSSGIEVLVKAKKEAEWYKIELLSGKAGWIKSDALELMRIE